MSLNTYGVARRLSFLDHYLAIRIVAAMGLGSGTAFTKVDGAVVKLGSAKP